MAAPARVLKVLVADDHPIVREGLRAIVVMDLQMADLDGVQATRQILAGNPRAVVLVLTMHEDDDMLAAALEAGARGYLLKGASHGDISRALRSVAAGEVVFGSGVADHVLARL